jgi:UDP-N-acetylmuramoyl-L-alanyl-D-glutamate--2,6-diaminopimelate ligase
VIGRFNASNLLAVIGVLLAGGTSLSDAVAAVATLAPPSGRLQTLGGRGAPLVVVDYAHTPDALDKALAALRESAAARGGQLICVFGCGGDRDAGKRPLMGAVAEALADRVILTSDNPRSENPDNIIASIRAGMTAAALVEADRAQAIRTAISSAHPCDVILLAGKGHETYQEIAGVRHPFFDVAHAQAALEQRA